jgi:hypothetical protein
MHLYRAGRLPVLPPLLQTRPGKGAAKPLLQIPRELAEVICGAVGEIVQVAVLYPLDTIKASILANCIYCCQIPADPDVDALLWYWSPVMWLGGCVQ